MAGRLWLRKNSTTVELPTLRANYAPGYIPLEVTDRTIDGTLVSDIIALKRKFDISWPIIDGGFMGQFVEWYVEREPLEFGEEQPDGSTVWFNVWMDIPESILREIEAGDYAFSGFRLNMVEI